MGEPCAVMRTSTNYVLEWDKQNFSKRVTYLGMRVCFSFAENRKAGSDGMFLIPSGVAMHLWKSDSGCSEENLGILGWI